MTAPAKSLKLGTLDPVLDVDTTIDGVGGEKIAVRSVYSLLQRPAGPLHLRSRVENDRHAG